MTLVSLAAIAAKRAGDQSVFIRKFVSQLACRQEREREGGGGGGGQTDRQADGQRTRKLHFTSIVG